MTAAVFSVTWLAMSATSRRLIQLTSKGARGRKNHFCGAPQVVEAQAVKETYALEVDHGSDPAGLAQIGRDARDVLEQAFLLDGVERGLGDGAGHRAAAKRGAEVFQFQ